MDMIGEGNARSRRRARRSQIDARTGGASHRPRAPTRHHPWRYPPRAAKQPEEEKAAASATVSRHRGEGRGARPYLAPSFFVPGRAIAKRARIEMSEAERCALI